MPNKSNRNLKARITEAEDIEKIIKKIRKKLESAQWEVDDSTGTYGTFYRDLREEFAGHEIHLAEFLEADDKGEDFAYPPPAKDAHGWMLHCDVDEIEFDYNLCFDHDGDFSDWLSGRRLSESELDALDPLARQDAEHRERLRVLDKAQREALFGFIGISRLKTK